MSPSKSIKEPLKIILIRRVFLRHLAYLELPICDITLLVLALVTSIFAPRISDAIRLFRLSDVSSLTFLACSVCVSAYAIDICKLLIMSNLSELARWRDKMDMSQRIQALLSTCTHKTSRTSTQLSSLHLGLRGAVGLGAHSSVDKRWMHCSKSQQDINEFSCGHDHVLRLAVEILGERAEQLFTTIAAIGALSKTA